MATPHFHTLRILDVRQETPTCVSISFDIPEQLANEFKYQSGQYVTLKKMIDGEEIRRSYSICSSPNEDDFRIAVKEVEGGIFSSFANHSLKVGDTIDVMNPIGNFTVPLQESQQKNYMAFAAGSGITPILSIMKSVLAIEPLSNFILIYGNQQIQSIMFREEIEGLKNTYMNRLQVIHVLSRERLETDLNNGRIDANKCKQLVSKVVNYNLINHFFLCGPEEMILSVRDYLVEQNVVEAKIKFELFTSSTTAATKAKQIYKETHTKDAEKMCSVTVKVDDRSFDLKLAYGGDSLLDAALKHGADLPFACKGGVCCTCKAKIIEGSVDMEVNYALEAEEVAAGYILTCQAHPTSERVVVDFDAR
jgi:ring-1,2-phenylacetyl-CoA epoxidase subunit PaaE